MNKAITAEVLAHSISPSGDELITFKTTSPKFIDAEIEKHRMISSNSSSDRAIPTDRLSSNDYFIPTDVRKNEKGMQGYEGISPEDLQAFQATVVGIRATILDLLDPHKDIHKQHLNRYLAAHTIQSKVMTANKRWFEYFFKLRAAPDADPTIQNLAEVMKTALSESTPVLLSGNDWHTPYYRDGHWIGVGESGYDKWGAMCKEALSRSVARCARASYDNFDGELSSQAEDDRLHKFLVVNLHTTPLEHQATPMTAEMFSKTKWPEGITHFTKDNKPHSGNLMGWIQHRQVIGEEL